MKLLFIVVLFPFLSFAQFTVQQDTISNSNNELTFSYAINGNVDLIDSINVTLFAVDSTDTLVLFDAVYIADEDDPSLFELFDFDENLNRIKLRIGSFESTLHFSRITIRKLDGILEEFIFN